MRSSISVSAPAKLNLALSVGPLTEVRAAGATEPVTLHPICSWMVTVNLFDELHLTQLERNSLSRYAILWHQDAKRRSDINWSITKDLAVRAHLALQRHVGRDLPVQMKLEKRIPVGGGLGGGSSDAAAMLRAVNHLYDLKLSLDELAEIGVTLGSDIPFLVRGGSAIVEGFGDQVVHHASHESPALHAVIAFPHYCCPTGRVYGTFDALHQEQGHPPRVRDQEVRSLVRGGENQIRRSEGLFNDLAAPAMRVAPQLEDDLAGFSQLAERPAHVSGSGSSLFVMCDDAMHAMALADAVERKLQMPACAVETSELLIGEVKSNVAV